MCLGLIVLSMLSKTILKPALTDCGTTPLWVSGWVSGFTVERMLSFDGLVSMDTSNTREILSTESGECKEISQVPSSQVPSLSEKHESSRVDIRLGGVINNVERGVLGLRVAGVVTGVEVRIGDIKL